MWEEGGRRHCFDAGGDANAREHLRDGLRDSGVVDVAVVGRMDREPEAVGITRLGKKLLCALGIVRLGFEIFGIAEEAFRQELTGGNRFAFHHPVDQRLAVDRLGDRFAHARIFQRILRERFAVAIGHEGRNVALGIHMQVDESVGDRPVE